VVEDNPDHAELIRRSFRKHHVANTLYHVPDGEVALSYLLRQGEYADPHTSPRPHVILLDLRLPRIDGLEVLREIKADATLRHIPVVILSTSDAKQDLTRAYNHHVNSYLVKPLDFRKFTEMMNDLGFYWLIWNCRP